MEEPFEFVCDACGWEGTAPTLDAHYNAFCPRCGAPAEFKAIAERRRSP